MMPILLPHLPTLPEPIRQLPQKELDVLPRLRETLLEDAVQVRDLRLLGRVGHLLPEEIQVASGVGEVGGGVEVPAGFEVSRDDLGRVEGFDQVEGFVPCGEEGGGFDFFDPEYQVLQYVCLQKKKLIHDE